MCRFRAKELLEIRRSIASNPTLTIPQIALIVKTIDDARNDHLERTGCQCWSEAIADASRQEAA